MAFTLLVAQGHDVGSSRVERDRVDEVRRLLDDAAAHGVEIMLPTDLVAAETPEAGAPHANVPLSAIGDRTGVDIGSATAARFADAIARAVGAAPERSR
jgi:phosphoglycerate kinase